MKIAFLINNAYGIGGTIRSTANLSGALAVRHDVEVVSVHRSLDQPALALDPRVKLTSLVDKRKDSPGYEGDHELTRQPNTMFHYGAAAHAYSALEDERIGAFLRDTSAHVVIGTRPDLNGFLARDGQQRYLRIGQEHLSLDAHNEQMRGWQNEAIAGLDAFVTVSEADAEQYRRALPDVRASIQCIPNGVPAPDVEPSALDAKTIAAAGRLIPVKRYDRLLEAFAKVAARHPSWTLRLYGRGPQRAELRRRIDELGLYNQAFLMGPVSPIETEWAKGAVAVSSDMESFGMTIVEAMHCGVPVVATDCPHGPGEIISHGTDGLLVPLSGGADAYADALNQLIEDAELRRRMGDAAREKAAAYVPRTIARRYEELIHDLSRERYLDGVAAAQAPTRPSLLKRVRRTLRNAFPVGAVAVPARPAVSVPASETAAPARPKKWPVAHTRVAVDGGLSIMLDAATLPAGALDLVLRLRRDPQEREVRVPVPRLDSSPSLHIGVTLKRDEHLPAEGRWDCYVVPQRTGRRHRLTARLVEQARLLTLPPAVGSDGVSAWIPYTTADGFLAVRTWQRPAHAEIDTVLVGEHSTTVTATLLGLAELTPEATVRAASRTAATHDFAVPVSQLSDDRFQFALPHDQALKQHTQKNDFWDLLLLPATDAAPIPIGRITGDIVERKKTDPWPVLALDHPSRGGTRLKPYFTVNNDLALNARDGGSTQ
ncbi:glycosyltransferase family 4 protein [Streptomyces monticola]|uniref:D-inositol 3-phosphate glycosyltransferase n=1 Tax=Streptomyces monticola TaxID=2666263 RepID=A0ABW2JST0_9ACTN